MCFFMFVDLLLVVVCLLALFYFAQAFGACLFWCLVLFLDFCLLILGRDLLVCLMF